MSFILMLLFFFGIGWLCYRAVIGIIREIKRK